MTWLNRLFSREPVTDRSHEIRASEQGRSSTIAADPAPDLVDGLNILAAYYRYVEAHAYDMGLKSARERRDFRDDLLSRMDALLAYEADSNASAQIQHELDKEASAFGSERRQLSDDAASDARSLDSEGYKMLALGVPLTWESLKAAYRSAVKAHHPDVGGDNATMQRINQAYGLFSALLRRRAAQEQPAELQQAAGLRVDRLFLNVRLQRLEILIDDFAADAALIAYRTFAIDDFLEAFGGANIVGRLCEELAAAGRAEEARSVLDDLARLSDQLALRGLNYGPVYRHAAKTVLESKPTRFVFNHVRQASNALRLGMIDQKRFDAVLQRIGDTEEQLAEDAQAFAAFASTRRFLDLPMDPSVDPTPVEGLIPGPDYYARVETLSQAQRREYARAFHDSSPQLASKYLAVRIDALLRAPFCGYADIDAIAGELKAIESAPGIKPGLRALCEEASAVVAFLAALPAPERAKRIQILNKLDCNPTEMHYAITIGPEGVVTSFPRPIFPNPQFRQFATGPLERIERYLSTGSQDTAEERAAQKRQWEASRTFHESEVYRRARDATWTKEKDPERIVHCVGELVEAMYDRVERTGDLTLEIGYWTDDLTINLVKLKRFDEAVRWMDRLDTLPAAIQQKTPGGITAALRKRRVRCEAAINRQRVKSSKGVNIPSIGDQP